MSILDKLGVRRDSPPLPDRPEPTLAAERHFVNGRPLKGPFPAGSERALFGLGCFWGAERRFWQLGDGVVVTAVGYAGGSTRNPTYEDVCSGRTGHAETALIVYDPARLPYSTLLRVFWESHDPTQGMRQGNDVGAQYRSAIYAYSAQQLRQAEAARRIYQEALTARGFGDITTEIAPAPPFYYAEDRHQQYLAKHPHGYCGLSGTGILCPAGIEASA